MFTEATDQPCVSAWVLDQIEAHPNITSAELRNIVPAYMAPRSVAPALTKLTADGAVERWREITDAGGNTFGYRVVDRDAATAHLTRPFRHLTVGDRPKGVTRNRGKTLPPTDRPEFNFEETNVTEPRIEIDAEDNVILPTYLAEGAFDTVLANPRAYPQGIYYPNTGMVDYGQHTGRIAAAAGTTGDTRRPTLKLHAVMSDGTEYTLHHRHVSQLRQLLGELDG